MTARSYATKWPAAFNPDDPTVLSIAAVVDEHVDVSADSPQLPLHTHPTGQLALSVGGLVGLQLESGYWSIPALCAIWVPPGVPHTGVLGLDGRSVYFHVGPSQLEGFPDEVVRMMLNPMAVEMVLFAARGLDRRRPEASRRLLALATIEEVRLASTLRHSREARAFRRSPWSSPPLRRPSGRWRTGLRLRA